MELVPKAEFSIVTRASKAWIPDSMDLCQDAHCRKNQKLFSKTSAQTVRQQRGGFATLPRTNVIKLGNSSNIITVGSRHNALVAAALLARTGNRVLAMVPMPGGRITTFIYRDLRQSKLQK
jgi:hypothetical protein